MAANNNSGTLMAIALLAIFYWLFVKNQLKTAAVGSPVLAGIPGAPTAAGPAGFNNPNLQFAFVGTDTQNDGLAELQNKAGTVMSAADFAADIA